LPGVTIVVRRDRNDCGRPESRCSIFANDDHSASAAFAPSVSLERQLEAVRREIKLRGRVYVTRVATRRMSAKRAAEEIAVMQAVEQTLVTWIKGLGLDEISGLEERLQELAERIDEVFDDIRDDLHAERPDLRQWEWPEPSEPKEDPDPLFDSRRSYVEHIDRDKRHQGKPTARRKRYDGEATP
jgi:hypothetical protein